MSAFKTCKTSVKQDSQTRLAGQELVKGTLLAKPVLFKPVFKCTQLKASSGYNN